MKNTRSIPLSLSLVVLAMSTLVGCGGGGDPSPTATNREEQPNKSISQSAATLVENGVGSEPAQSVAIFLDSLRRGDEKAANGVLSAKAREELSKTAYVIQPLGTPAGKYSIGRILFPYEEKTVALVECLWTEPATATEESISMDIVCEVHQETEGWRISGMGVTIPGTEETLVLDFEDAVSLQATIDAATGQTPPPQQQTATRGQPFATQSLPDFGLPQLPPGQPSQSQAAFQLPDLPAVNATPGSAPAQTAMPPQYNEPLRR